MGDAEIHMRYHHHHCHLIPWVLGVPSKAGCEDAEEQHQSPAHPLPLPGAACSIPRAPHGAAGRAQVK